MVFFKRTLKGVAALLKWILIDFLALLSWLSLLIAVVATSAILTLSSLSHFGDFTSSFMQDSLKDRKSVNMLIDEFEKSADTRTAKQIEKNRVALNQAIESLVTSTEFQNELSQPLNRISEGILAGSESVKVDFSKLATLVAAKVNASAKTKVISKSEVADLKPTLINIKVLSKNYSDIHDNLNILMLACVIWILLFVSLFFLKRHAVLRTAGRQLLSIGIPMTLLTLSTPFAVGFAIKFFSAPSLVTELIPKLVGSLLSPTLILAIVVSLFGIVLTGTHKYLVYRGAKTSQAKLIQPVAMSTLDDEPPTSSI